MGFLLATHLGTVKASRRGKRASKRQPSEKTEESNVGHLHDILALSRGAAPAH
jgi:hypothetical protein